MATIVGKAMDLDVPRTWAPLKIAGCALTYTHSNSNENAKIALVKASMLTENKYKSQLRHSRQKSMTLLRVRLGTRPARKHEANLVHEISNVVYYIEGRLIG